MKVEWSLNEYFNFIHSFSATRRCMDSIGSDFFDDAYNKVAKLWGNGESRRMVVLDFVFIACKNCT